MDNFEMFLFHISIGYFWIGAICMRLMYADTLPNEGV
jgi:hypothetical protein